jgi:death-on-curing protein
LISVRFLKLDAVLSLHDKALMAYAGLPGIRDEGLLLSALARAENKLAYSEPGSVDIVDLAAAYAFGIASNHPFNDANKRTAWASCVLFLKANGVELGVLPDIVLEKTVELASRQIDEPAFAAWLRTIAHPQAPGATR